MRYIYIHIYTQRSNQWTDTWRGVYWIRRRGEEKEQRGIMLRIKCNNMLRISRLGRGKRKYLEKGGIIKMILGKKNCDDLERTCIERVQVSGESTRFRLKYVIRSNLNGASSLSKSIHPLPFSRSPLLSKAICDRNVVDLRIYEFRCRCW